MTVPSLSTAHSPQGSPALTGRPALSQRLSGRGLPARMTQVRDTGCPSRTRMMEALLAICGGAVGRGNFSHIVWGHRPTLASSLRSLGLRMDSCPLGHGARTRGTIARIHWSNAVATRGPPGYPQPGWSTCLPLPTPSRFTHRPCPVTSSRASAWAFPNTLRASHTYRAWSSGAVPEERNEAAVGNPQTNTAGT